MPGKLKTGVLKRVGGKRKLIIMRKIFLTIALLGVVLIGNAQEILTNNDIIAMKGAKISESIITTKIRTSDCNFDLSPNGLINLKEEKISERIVLQMISSSPPDNTIGNDDIIKMNQGKISDRIIKEMINNSPHNFDVSPDGLIKLNTAKVSKAIIKEMMSEPVKTINTQNEDEQAAKRGVAVYTKDGTNAVAKPRTTPKVADPKKCKPIETNDLETNEKYILYGNTFNSGGVIGALAGNADRSKESVSVFGGFRGDKTIILFQLDRIVGENFRNKTNLKELYVKKGEKIIVVTSTGNIPFYTMEESRSKYKKEITGLTLGEQERISLQALCLATKLQIEKLATATIKEIVFVTTNGHTSTIRPTNGELKFFVEKLNCLIASEKYQNSPDSPSIEMTSDEAIAELKKAKDKYDLGLITKEEYEAIKMEIKKYIK